VFLVDRLDSFVGEDVGAAPALSDSDVALVRSCPQSVEKPDGSVVCLCAEVVLSMRYL